MAPLIWVPDHGIGKMDYENRLESIMKNGGITGCGNAQNCVRACPKENPLTTAIPQLNRDTTVHGIKNWFHK